LTALYSFLHYLILPWALLRLAWRGVRDPAYCRHWGERFGLGATLPGNTRTLWVHAVSVGEVHAAVPLVQALYERDPQARVVLTTTTPTGRERAIRLLPGGVVHRYVPYDIPGAVRRFLDRIRPGVAIMIETELWPNILRQCRQRGIPLVVANARLSERSTAGYRRVAGFTRRMLADVAALAVQSRDDAERFIGLGADPARVKITGSIKFDIRLSATLREQGEVMRRCWGVDRGVWIAASTHEGEDEQVLDAFAQVRQSVPDCLLVLVPRHPERFERTAALCRRRGYRTVLRSDAPETCHDADVFIGNTMGELTVFYAASDVALVGGTLVEKGGHNMLEPAALGVPVIVGPCVFNFAEITRRLCEVGAARQVRDAAALARTVAEFLLDANLRHGVGERGRGFVEHNRGALDRLMEIVGPLMIGG